MMKLSAENHMVLSKAVRLCCIGVLLTVATPAIGTSADTLNFDHQGKKRFTAYQVTPDVYLQADSGDRNLQSFYELRQYPGSPPRIPHEANLTVGPGATECLSCHGEGGYSPEFGKFVPVTPHPENSLCYQCHVPVSDGQPFVAHGWQSVEPPKLGRSFLPGAPPPVPHSLQLRENCVACHTGPGAVVEIRVSHAARGDCRQCHAPVVQSEPMVEFRRN